MQDDVRSSKDILSERLALVGDMAKLNAEHVRLLQMAAGAQIATLDDDAACEVKPYQKAIDTINDKLRDAQDKITALDRELEKL